MTRLLASFWSQARGNFQQRCKFLVKERWLECSLVLLSALYALLYIAIVVPKIETTYAEAAMAGSAADMTQLSTLAAYLQLDPLLTVFLLTLIARATWLVAKRQPANFFWEPLALGCVLYVVAYIQLGLRREYYLAPVDFCAVLYLSWIAYRTLGSMQPAPQRIVRGVALFLVGALLVVNASISSRIILDLKKFTTAHVQLAEFLKHRDFGRAERVRLWFPTLDAPSPSSDSHSSYRIMELMAFLDYKGIALVPKNYHRLANRDRPALAMYLAEKLEGTACVPWMPYQCYYLERPQPGDLIGILPNYDGNFSDREVENRGLNLTPIFHYQPHFSGLEKVLWLFQRSHPLPEQWMNLEILQVN